MSQKVKLYDKDGNYLMSVEPFKHKFDELSKHNKEGRFVKAQFNKSMTKVVTSYNGVEIVTTEKFNDPFKLIK